MDIQSINTAALASSANVQSPVRPPVSTASSASVTEQQTFSRTSVSYEQLQGAVSAANEFVKPINNEIQFSVDKDSGEMVVKVTDTSTNEVIRQIPSEEMLAVAQALNKFQGLLLKQKA